MEKTVKILIEEKDGPNVCKALLIMGEIYAKDYRYHKDAIFCAQTVKELQSDKTHRDHIIATTLLANLTCRRDVDESNKLMLSLDGDAITKLKKTSDLLDVMSVSASIAHLAGDDTSANYFYSLIKKIDYLQLNDYELNCYILALANYSVILFNRGDYIEGLDLNTFCSKVLQDKNLSLSTAGLTIMENTSSFLTEFEEYETAQDFVLTYLDIIEKQLGLTSTKCISYVNLLSYLLARQKDFDNSYKLLTTQIELQEAISTKPSWTKMSLWASLGDTFYLKGDYSAESSARSKVINIAKSIHLYRESSYTKFLHSLYNSGQQKMAIQTARETLSAFRQHLHDRFLSLSERSRESYWSSTAIELINAVSLVTSTPDDNDGILYDASLLSKGLLMDSSSQFIKYIHTSKEPELRELWLKYSKIRDSLRELEMHEESDSTLIKQLESDLYNSEAELMFHARKNELGYLAPYSITWKDIQKELPENAVSIEYIRYRDNLKRTKYTASILRPHFNPVNIPLDVDENLLASDSLDLLYSSDLVFKAFFKPLLPYMEGVNTVYFSPTGVLNNISLECSPINRTMTIGDKFNMIRLTSTRNIAEQNDSKEWHSAILFGGLNYSAGLDEMEYYASSARSGNAAAFWPYLKGAQEEVDLLATIMNKGGNIDVDTITGDMGVEESFLNLSGCCPDILHIATHGYYDKDAVEASDYSGERAAAAMVYSGLVFSGANNHATTDSGISDGLLPAEDIAKMDLTGCKLVTLSACNTGQGYSHITQEHYGLTRAFKKAGCQTIVMSLWEVDDLATRSFMMTFYDALLTGTPVHQAIQYARVELRKNHPNTHEWAAFIALD